MAATKPTIKMPKNRRDVARLISQAERLIDHLEFDRATACYQKALKLDPSSALALEGLGEHLLAMGNVERAKELLLKAIQLAPEIGASKYFNMAQIVDGEEALSYHRRGIEVVAADLALVKSGQKAGKVDELRTLLCAGYCGCAELYLARGLGTEEECERMLLQGLEEDPSHFELLQTYASLRILQNRVDEARDFLKRSYATWSSKEIEDWPCFAFCHNTAKLFIEIHEYQIAAEILEAMLNVQDNVAEVWYYLSLAYSFFDISEAADTLNTTKKLVSTLEEPDTELQADIENLEAKLRGLGAGEELDHPEPEEPADIAEPAENEDLVNDDDGEQADDITEQDGDTTI